MEGARPTDGSGANLAQSASLRRFANPLAAAGSTFFVLALAKIALVTLRIFDGGVDLLGTPFGPIALLYEDVWVSAGVGAMVWLVGLAVGPRAAAWVGVTLFTALSLYAAFNVPLARVLSTPLTYPMLAAAHGTLADSILFYATVDNLSATVIVALAAVAVALWLPAPATKKTQLGFVAVALIFVALGPTSLSRTETLGLHRNAALTMASTALRRIDLSSHSQPIATQELAAEGDALDLTHLEGLARGRNVIFVILESTGAQYLRAYGAERDATPHLTQLAQRGIVFESVYAAYPESIKGLWSILCGDAPSPHTSAQSYTHEKLPEPCIAERFSEAGYRTGLFHSGRFRFLGMEDAIRHRGFDILEDADTIPHEFDFNFGSDDMSTALRTLDFIRESAELGRPFFAVYMPISGHHPYNTPGEGPRPFPENSDQDRYLNDLHAGDAALGALVRGVEEAGQAGRTLWVIVGDHAEAFYQHQGNFAHSLFLYEENVWVPAIVVLPGIVNAALRAPQVGSLIDISPTLAALVGLPALGRATGKSLLSSGPGVARFFTDHGLYQVGLRQGDWKFILEVDTGRPRLYRFPEDRAEQENIAEQHPDRVAAYSKHLRSWLETLRHRVSEPLVIRHAR